MWKGKRLLRKSGAIVLALALTVSPLGAMAADAPGSSEDPAAEVTVEGNTVTPVAGDETEGTVAGTEADAPVTEADSADTSDTEEEQNTTSDETEKVKKTETEGETETDEKPKTETEAEAETDEKPKTAAEADVETETEAGQIEMFGAALAADGQFDTNQPVVEEVVFEQNGQTLKQTDELKIGVRAYDADSSIQSIRVHVAFEDENDESYNGYSDSIELQQNPSDAKLYEGSMKLEGIVYDSGHITSIVVVDAFGNVNSSYQLYDQETNSPIYAFKVEPKALDTVKVTDLKFNNPGTTLIPNEVTDEFSFKLDSDVDLTNGNLYVRFKNAENGSTQNYYAYSVEYPSDGRYSGTISAEEWMTSGKWVFDAVVYEEKSKQMIIETESVGDIWYEFKIAGKGDQEAPKLESVEVDRNGQILQPGDVVNFKVQVSDDVALDTSNSSLYLYAAASNIEPSDHYVELIYNADTDTFEGQFEITEETYPCEWYIGDINITDKAGNWVEDQLWEQDYPYYFQVVNGNSFVNPTHQATISFMALDENGTWQQIGSVEKEDVERRTTLGELGIVFPEVTPVEGVAFLGWSDYEGNPINENTQIVEDAYINAYAVYDKSPVHINYTYLTEDGYRTSETELKFVPKDSLKKDVIAEAVKKEPPVSFGELKFQEWSYYSEDEDSPVGKDYYLSLDAVYDKSVVWINYAYLSEHGYQTSETEMKFVPKDTLKKDVIAEAVKKEPPVSYEGLKFQKWSYTVEDEEAPVENDCYLSLNAVYDKSLVQIEYSYYNEDGYRSYEREEKLVPNDTLKKDIIAEAVKKEPATSYEGLKFQEWDYYSEGEDTAVGGSLYNLRLDAVYDKSLVRVHYDNYYDENGHYVSDTVIKLMSKDTLRKDVIAEALKKEVPAFYEGLNFVEWSYNSYNEDETVGNEFSIYLTAKYDKLLVRFLVHPAFANGGIGGMIEEQDCDVASYKVANSGDVVGLPVSSEKYGNYTWFVSDEEKASGTIVVSGDRIIYGYGSKNGGDTPEEPEKPVDPEEPSKPEKPVDPEEPSKPEKPVDPEEPSKPEEPSEPEEPESPVVPEQPEVPSAQEGIELPEESIDQIVNNLENMDEGSAYTIDMGNATVVPKDVLEAAKGKDIDVKLNMGGYTWTINGKNISAADLKDINLEVKMNTDAIPSKTVQALAGGNPTKQISLTHEGDFGFQATLTMNVGSEYAGKHGNLYWYDSSHKMVFVDAGMIQANGEVSLNFSHASDYVIVMSDEVMGEAEAEAVNGTETGGSNNEKSVKTGDSSSFLLIFALLALSAATAGVVLYRRKVR